MTELKGQAGYDRTANWEARIPSIERSDGGYTIKYAVERPNNITTSDFDVEFFVNGEKVDSKNDVRSDDRMFSSYGLQSDQTQPRHRGGPETISQSVNAEPGDKLRVEVDEFGGGAVDLETTLGEVVTGSGPSDLDREPDNSGAVVRDRLRDKLDDALKESKYDADNWNTDARADGTLILQDPETNRTRTIEAGSGESGIYSAVESLGSSDSKTTSTGDSFDPTASSSSSDATSPGPSVDDLGGGRLAAAVAIGAAILYGATQSCYQPQADCLIQRRR